jgi:hypothetical protein
MGGSPTSPSADDALMQQMAQAAMAKRGMR